jgi:Fic family protein
MSHVECPERAAIRRVEGHLLHPPCPHTPGDAIVVFMPWIYILRCADNSLYVGLSGDVESVSVDAAGQRSMIGRALEIVCSVQAVTAERWMAALFRTSQNSACTKLDRPLSPSYWDPSADGRKKHVMLSDVNSHVGHGAGSDAAPSFAGAAFCGHRAQDPVARGQAIQNFEKRLSDERLFGWHAAMFPTGRSGMRKIVVGAWRDDTHGPMQIVSGPVGKEKVHYEAPAASVLDQEMSRFFDWANDAADKTDPVLRAALAHLWFVTIHPFDDGNGRIARAITDWSLARSENSPQRFYSMSAQIRHERNAYYGMLEHTQKGTLDITPWMEWFLACLGRAFEGTETTLAAVFDKARFWEKHAQLAINDRQRAIVNRLLDGFEGKLTTVKWAKLEDVSHDTALRDIQELIELGVLKKDQGGGRSTSYSLAAN